MAVGSGMYDSHMSCGMHWTPSSCAGYYRPLLMSDGDIERLATAVVKKLEAKEPKKPKSWEDLCNICANCRQPKDSPGHELGCKVGRKEYGHED